ncbi:hypothetical protein JT226_07650 [Helicobacter pylori]|nr:hypothetical protein [Helicobacter pylori]
MTHFVRIAFLFYSFKVFQTTQKFFPFVVRLISLLIFKKVKKFLIELKFHTIHFSKKMVFFQDPKKGQDNTQKEKNVHFLSGGVLRRQLNKGAVGFLKKNLKMRAFFLAIFWNFVRKYYNTETQITE